MLERVLKFSIEHRYLIVLGIIAVAALGAYSLQRLPIDAVPDITPNQVQINTVVAGLSPLEIEKQVTFPIETALAGIPGLTQTRSLSRNGFSQVLSCSGTTSTSISPGSRSTRGWSKFGESSHRGWSRGWVQSRPAWEKCICGQSSMSTRRKGSED